MSGATTPPPSGQGHLSDASRPTGAAKKAVCNCVAERPKCLRPTSERRRVTVRAQRQQFEVRVGRLGPISGKKPGPASRATCRAEERSVTRREAFASLRRLRQSWRRMADDGLRPFPPYRSFMVGGWPATAITVRVTVATMPAPRNSSQDSLLADGLSSSGVATGHES